MLRHSLIFFFFFFNDTATTEIYTLSLHDALPICRNGEEAFALGTDAGGRGESSRVVMPGGSVLRGDRKSTRLNSSHSQISYAVFCLKKKKKKANNQTSNNIQGDENKVLYDIIIVS